MNSFQDTQIIHQLDKRRGGYYYITIPAEVVNSFENKRNTRFICSIDDKLTFSCGLNHLGDGNFFIILGTKNLVSIDKKLGDSITFEISEDPNPLGVEIPEVLEALLEQDEELKKIFEGLTMGKKRSVIYSISRIKDIDKQIQNAIKAIHEVSLPRKKKEL